MDSKEKTMVVDLETFEKFTGHTYGHDSKTNTWYVIGKAKKETLSIKSNVSLH